MDCCIFAEADQVALRQEFRQIRYIIMQPMSW